MMENLYSEMDYCMVGRKSGSFVALLLYCTISGSLLGGKSKVITSSCRYLVDDCSSSADF